MTRYELHKSDLVQQGFRVVSENHRQIHNNHQTDLVALLVKGDEFGVVNGNYGLEYRGYDANKEHFLRLNPNLQFVFDYFESSPVS